jgi:hypothetical protein
VCTRNDFDRVLHDLRAVTDHGTKRPERQSARIKRVGQKLGLNLKLAAGQSKTVKVSERVKLAAAGWRRRVDDKKLHRTCIVLSHSDLVDLENMDVDPVAELAWQPQQQRLDCIALRAAFLVSTRISLCFVMTLTLR